MPEVDWGPTIAGLAAQNAALEAVLTHLLAEWAKQHSHPRAVLSAMFEEISGVLDQFLGSPAASLKLSEMTRARVSVVFANASQKAGDSPT